MPEVSVIVTGYNSAPTIVQAIDSVRAQTVGDFELIFVDDASTDNTVALVESIADPRIRIIRNSKNRGIGGAKNVGIKAARGDYIAFLDSDDTWTPHKLAIQLPAVKLSVGRPPLAFAAFWVHRIGVPTASLRCPRCYGTWLRSLLMGENLSLGSTLLAARDCFETVGLFDERLIRLEDRDWTIRYLLRWDELTLVSEPLAHINNSGWPRAETIERSVEDLYCAHEKALQQHGSKLARLFRASLDFEVAVAYYRAGRPIAATRRVAVAVVRHRSFAGYLAGRARRKLVERDFA